MGSVKKPREPKRQPGYYELYLGEKCIGTKLALVDFFPRYFINLDNNINSDLEGLLSKYESIWKSKGKIYYVDSWGHRWEQGPSKNKLLEYLSNYEVAEK